MPVMKTTYRIGTAGWAIPRSGLPEAEGEGSQLQRYARSFNAVEINSTFYRMPMARTLERWAADTPPDLRFAVKLARSITHASTAPSAAELRRSVERIQHLGAKCGPLLVQFAPSRAFDGASRALLRAVRRQWRGALVCEPRHLSWGALAATTFFHDLGIVRVVADPERMPVEGDGARQDLAYFRLHGSPRVYWSAYDEAALVAWAARIRSAAPHAAERWVIFDNTAAGHALHNALRMRRLLDG